MPDMKEVHEKQKTEGHCFLCNKQGHLKKDCLLKCKEGPSTKKFKVSPTAQETHLKERVDNEQPNKVSSQELDDLMMKLQGKAMNDRDEIIDALVYQESF